MILESCPKTLIKFFKKGASRIYEGLKGVAQNIFGVAPQMPPDPPIGVLDALLIEKALYRKEMKDTFTAYVETTSATYIDN